MALMVTDTYTTDDEKTSPTGCGARRLEQAKKGGRHHEATPRSGWRYFRSSIANRRLLEKQRARRKNRPLSTAPSSKNAPEAKIIRHPDRDEPANSIRMMKELALGYFTRKSGDAAASLRGITGRTIRACLTAAKWIGHPTPEAEERECLPGDLEAAFGSSHLPRANVANRQNRRRALNPSAGHPCRTEPDQRLHDRDQDCHKHLTLRPAYYVRGSVIMKKKRILIHRPVNRGDLRRTGCRARPAGTLFSSRKLAT